LALPLVNTGFGAGLPAQAQLSLRTTNQLEKPRFIIFALQSNKMNKTQANPSHFDHCQLTNLKVHLNSEIYLQCFIFIMFRHKSYPSCLNTTQQTFRLIPTFSSPHHVTTPPNAQPRFKSPPQFHLFAPRNSDHSPLRPPPHPSTTPFTSKTETTPPLMPPPTTNNDTETPTYNAIGPPLTTDTPTIPTTSVPKVSQKVHKYSTNIVTFENSSYF
jgi:hypothetical protein